MTTLSDGVTTVTPILVDGYTSTRESGNVVHTIIASASPEVTLRAARLRTGTLVLLFATQAEALAAEALHALPVVLTLADPDVSGINMSYVAHGTIVVELDDQTRELWTVSVDFQEVTP
jgi:hypothetical protein